MAAARLAAHTPRFVSGHVGRVTYHTEARRPGGAFSSTADVHRVLPVLMSLHVELGMGTSATCYICAGAAAGQRREPLKMHAFSVTHTVDITEIGCHTVRIQTTF